MPYARFDITATRERRRHHRRGSQQPQNQVMLYPLDLLEFGDRLVPLGWRAVRTDFPRSGLPLFGHPRLGFVASQALKQLTGDLTTTHTISQGISQLIHNGFLR